MNWNFDYRGMHVETPPNSLETTGYDTLQKKKSYFISMLEQHPEGIVIYNHSKPHAVLLCDYNQATDTFYCADPATSEGRIPLVNSTIPGDTQDKKINNSNQIWYISSNSNRKDLISTEMTWHCPVDVRISIGAKVLDSRTITGSETNSYATMIVTGSGINQNVEVAIQGDYSVSEGIGLELFGSDTGSMTFTVTHTYSDSTVETHTFKNVPITPTTVGNASGFYPQSTVLLTMMNTEDPDNATYWTADPNEVVTEPSTDFGDIIDDSGSNTPSTPSRPNDSGGYYGGNSSGGSSSSNPSYQVTVSSATNGTVTVTPKSAKSGDKVTITAKPNDGYAIDSVIVTDSSGKSISITDNGDSTYTFTMPSSKVTVNVTFVQVQVEQPPVEPVETPWVNPFPDVSKNDWFYDDVAYVVQNGLMGSMDNGQFNPNGTTTRGMLMTILARLEGIDTSSSNPWYQTGMEWAMRTGVPDGSNPEGNITREELATMLWRYAGEPAVTGDLSSYPDTDNVHDWASTAMAWAVQNGIINGMDGKLNPQGNAIRAQVAAMLTRFCKNIVK